MKKLNALRTAGFRALAAPCLAATVLLADAVASADARPIAPEPHPYTLDPGRFQIEFTPIEHRRESQRTDGTKTTSDQFDTALTLKYGLTENADLQVGGTWSFLRDRSGDDGTVSTKGLGPLTLRVKVNLFGNAGDTEGAMSLMPYLTVPGPSRSLGSRQLEGGLMAPMDYDFDGPWNVELTPHLGMVRNARNSGHVLDAGALLVVTRATTERMDLFAELFQGKHWGADGAHVATLGPGITIAVNDDLVLEWALFLGMTRRAPDTTLSFTVLKRF